MEGSGGGLGEPAIQPTVRNSVKRRKILMGSAVAAIVILSVFSAVLYVRMQDYYDAKYRAQGTLMMSISGYAYRTDEQVHDAVNTSLPDSARAVGSAKAISYIGAMDYAVRAVHDMYLGDREKCETFHGLDNALLAFETWFMEYETFPWMDSLDFRTKLSAAGDALYTLGPVIDASFRQNVDFEKHPYSVVGRLDLKAVQDISATITSQFSGGVTL